MDDTYAEDRVRRTFWTTGTAAVLKATLSPAAQEFATIQKAQFQDAGAGRLTLVLDGQLQLSDEQAKQFAVQLKQRLSAQANSPQ